MCSGLILISDASLLPTQPTGGAIRSPEAPARRRQWRWRTCYRWTEDPYRSRSGSWSVPLYRMYRLYANKVTWLLVFFWGGAGRYICVMCVWLYTNWWLICIGGSITNDIDIIVIGSRFWNTLPDSVTSAPSLCLPVTPQITLVWTVIPGWLLLTLTSSAYTGQSDSRLAVFNHRRL